MTSFLRSLTPAQQVSLLFVIVFGLLTLASAISVLLSMRAGRASDALLPQGAGRLRDYKALLRTSWLMAIVFWLAWAAGPGLATVLFGLVSFFILREFISLSPTRRGDHRSLLMAFFLVLPLHYR